jgi:hypothetical protein
MSKFIEPGKRFMDIAYLRDGSVIHTGEALALAILLHAKGRTKRASEEVNQVAKMLDDPNLKTKRTPRRK